MMDGKIIFTQERFDEMMHQCISIAHDFYDWCSKNRKVYDVNDEEPDPEDCAVSDERIEQLFQDLSKAMNVNPSCHRFRDNDVYEGRYTEDGNYVLLPYCLNYAPEKDIVKTICHELFHAFQYCAICNPGSYPFLTKDLLEKWRYEFDPNNYENGDRDSRKYRGQEIEKSAREFAEEICKCGALKVLDEEKDSKSNV